MTLACSQPPPGQQPWSLRLLADRLVELEIVETISHHTVGRVLKNELKPWLKRQWCIPPQANAEFVWRMEEVLAVYTRPSDRARPVVCLDEPSTHLLRDVRAPRPPAPRQAARIDAEYERHGVVNRCLLCEPLTGRRWVQVTEQRPKTDWAQQLKQLVDERFPAAERIVLVQDKLHHPPPRCPVCHLLARRGQTADRLDRMALHPQAWQLAEHGRDRIQGVEPPGFAAVGARPGNAGARKCRRAGTAQSGSRPLDWRFTTDDARIKLKRLYPSYEV